MGINLYVALCILLTADYRYIVEFYDMPEMRLRMG